AAPDPAILPGPERPRAHRGVVEKIELIILISDGVEIEFQALLAYREAHFEPGAILQDIVCSVPAPRQASQFGACRQPEQVAVLQDAKVDAGVESCFLSASAAHGNAADRG